MESKERGEKKETPDETDAKLPASGEDYSLAIVEKLFGFVQKGKENAVNTAIDALKLLKVEEKPMVEGIVAANKDSLAQPVDGWVVDERPLIFDPFTTDIMDGMSQRETDFHRILSLQKLLDEEASEKAAFQLATEKQKALEEKEKEEAIRARTIQPQTEHTFPVFTQSMPEVLVSEGCKNDRCGVDGDFEVSKSRLYNKDTWRVHDDREGLISELDCKEGCKSHGNHECTWDCIDNVFSFKKGIISFKVRDGVLTDGDKRTMMLEFCPSIVFENHKWVRTKLLYSSSGINRQLLVEAFSAQDGGGSAYFRKCVEVASAPGFLEVKLCKLKAFLMSWGRSEKKEASPQEEAGSSSKRSRERSAAEGEVEPTEKKGRKAGAKDKDEEAQPPPKQRGRKPNKAETTDIGYFKETKFVYKIAEVPSYSLFGGNKYDEDLLLALTALETIRQGAFPSVFVVAKKLQEMLGETRRKAWYKLASLALQCDSNKWFEWISFSWIFTIHLERDVYEYLSRGNFMQQVLDSAEGLFQETSLHTNPIRESIFGDDIGSLEKHFMAVQFCYKLSGAFEVLALYDQAQRCVDAGLEAVSMLKSASNFRLEKAKLHLRRGNIRRRSNDLEGANQDYDQVAKLYGLDVILEEMNEELLLKKMNKDGSKGHRLILDEDAESLVAPYAQSRGLICFADGKYSRAKTYFKLYCAMVSQKVGGLHAASLSDPNSIKVLYDIANLTVGLSNEAYSWILEGSLEGKRAALKQLEYANNIMFSCLGKHHAYRASILHALGVAYFYLEDTQKALKLFEESAEIRVAVGLVKHSRFAASLNALSCCYYLLGDNRQALLCGTESITTLSSVASLSKRDERHFPFFSETHPDYKIVESNLHKIVKLANDCKTALFAKDRIEEKGSKDEEELENSLSNDRVQLHIDSQEDNGNVDFFSTIEDAGVFHQLGLYGLEAQFYRERIPGLGDCAPQSISFYLADADVMLLRFQVQQWAARNRDFVHLLEEFPDDRGISAAELIDRIGMEREWVGEEFMQAAAGLLGRTIVVVTPEHIQFYPEPDNRDSVLANDDTIFIAYNGHSHYDPLIRRGDVIVEKDLPENCSLEVLQGFGESPPTSKAKKQKSSPNSASSDVPLDTGAILIDGKLLTIYKAKPNQDRK